MSWRLACAESGANDRFLDNPTIRWRGQEWLLKVEFHGSIVVPPTAGFVKGFGSWPGASNWTQYRADVRKAPKKRKETHLLLYFNPHGMLGRANSVNRGKLP